MKTKTKFIGFITLVITASAFIALSGCDNGSSPGGGGGRTQSDPTTATYSGLDGDGNAYNLEIKKADRAAAVYEPKDGDNYVLTVTFAEWKKGTKTSSGKITIKGDGYELDKEGTKLTVKIESGKMTSMSGTISFDKGGDPLPVSSTLATVPPGGVTQTCSSISDFAAGLSNADKNTPATAYNIKLNINDLGGDSKTSGSLGKTLSSNSDKYVKLDLSGSTFTSIGHYAFAECTSLTSVTIPDSVTSISGWAFEYCISLTSIIIPNNVTSIGNWAFNNCESLTSVTFAPTSKLKSIEQRAFQWSQKLANVTIPASVTSIDNAFCGCTNLKEIKVDSANTAYISDNGVLYDKAKTKLVQYPAGKTDAAFTIPSSVTSIERGAFEGGYLINSVTIPNSVTSIGEHAFQWCHSLTNVTIPASVTSIDKGTFGGCSNLKEIKVDSANTKYSSQDSVLYNKDKTILVQYPNGKTDAVFTIPDGVTSIMSSAFDGCSLNSITIPASVTSIGEVAFSESSRLTSVTFAAGSNISDEDFGNNAFPEGKEVYWGNFGNKLKTAYSTGRAGTYTWNQAGDTWTKI